ncbi:MAG: CHAD domain-containing protein [Novosphingobium sp.]
MPLAPETEIKLAASPAMLERLRSHPALAGTDRRATLHATYYDTIGGRLWKNGAILRIRDDGQMREQTLKLDRANGATIRRLEWNVHVESDEFDILAFAEDARAKLSRLLDGGTPEAFAISHVDRTARLIRFGESSIEVAFDSGSIAAARRKVRLSELELELVDGTLADVLALASELPLGPGLRWSLRSKAARCHDLAFNMAPAAERAQPLVLSPGMTAAAGFQTIAWNCLSQLLANYPLVIETGDAEAVHQSRVAIRRLRAAFTLFGGAIEDTALRPLRAELKAAAGALGPARDLQVVVERALLAIGQADIDSGDLLTQLGASRANAVRSAQDMLSGRDFQLLLSKIALWIEAGEWLGRSCNSTGDRQLMDLASKVLSRHRRKVRKLGGNLRKMPDASRHRLRIEVKKLRYATEFFASLFRQKKAVKHRKSFTRALASLQDSLGELNDLAVASAGRTDFFESLEPVAAARLTANLAQLFDAHRTSRRRLLKRAEASLEEIVDSPSWWSGD